MDDSTRPRAERAFRPELGFPLSLVHRLGERDRERWVPLRLPDLMAHAERATGLSDYGDDGGFRRRLEHAFDSLMRIEWNIIGRLGVRTNLLWNLTNRLRLVHALQRYPEIRATPIEPPVVVLGLFRTGSTFLHNVLAADPALRAGRNWQFSHPVGRREDPLGDVAFRRLRTWLMMTTVRWMVPDQDEVHELGVDQYEEDFLLLENDFANLKFIVGLGDFQLGWDLLGEDLTTPYAWHRLQMQMLSHGSEPARWLLKSPWHLWNLESFLATYPGAKIIQTHRDVGEAIASQCSLTGRIACRLQSDLDPFEVGRFTLRYAAAGLARGLAVRDRLPASQVFDVRLGELRRETEEVLRALYRHLDLAHDETTFARLLARAAAEPKLQSGVHTYTLEDFGLTDDDLRRELGPYATRFGLRIGGA